MRYRILIAAPTSAHAHSWCSFVFTHGRRRRRRCRRRRDEYAISDSLSRDVDGLLEQITSGHDAITLPHFGEMHKATRKIRCRQ